MRRLGLMGIALLGIITASSIPPALAQEGPGGTIVPQRDCQSIVTCRFAKGGSYRGCISSYSCRVCNFVPAKCTIGRSRGKVCNRLRCSWGA